MTRNNIRVGHEMVAAAGSASAAPPAKRQRTGGAGASTAAGRVDGDEGDRMACDAETVYRLCGRVLAKALLQVGCR